MFRYLFSAFFINKFMFIVHVAEYKSAMEARSKTNLLSVISGWRIYGYSVTCRVNRNLAIMRILIQVAATAPTSVG